ncbi:hypothetical protein BKA80DRAFT_1898 [Phyllosticta citrichinensis]
MVALPWPSASASRWHAMSPDVSLARRYETDNLAFSQPDLSYLFYCWSSRAVLGR